MDDHLLSIAENANTHQPLAPGHERIENERFVLWMGIRTEPAWNVAQRLRLAADTIDDTIAEVHAWQRTAGRSAAGRSEAPRRPPTWSSGSSTVGCRTTTTRR